MRLTVSFPLDGNWSKNSQKVRNAVKKFHASEAGSGAGFGKRDIDFDFKKEKDLDSARAAIEKLKIEGLELSEY
jgi:hypothetical protein